jgi:serine/threonine-protein kinase
VPPPPTPAPPRRLGRYELGEEIAHGGMGAVFHAYDPELHRHLAVKVLKPELRQHPQLLRRFLVEARITGQLQHPGIVAVHDIGRDEHDLPFLVMKLVRGQTLAELLRKRSRVTDDLSRWLAVFEQVCQAVAFAHSHRVIHRDLKPANIMVGRFQEVQVMDWGLAKVRSTEEAPGAKEQVEAEFSLVETLEEGVRTHGTLGSPQYMPPEQALGEWHCVDERADVFALGGILCEVLTGQPTYPGSSAAEVLARARRGAIDDASARMDACGADRELVTLALECLSPEIEQRPRDAGVVAQRVAAYQRGVQERLRQAEQERAAAQARVIEERKRRRLTIVLAAVLVLLLLAGGSGAWLLQQHRARQHEAAARTMHAVEHARELLQQGWQANDLAILQAAQAEASKAAEIARSGAADQATQQAAATVQQEIDEQLARIDRDRALLDDLLNISFFQESGSERSDASGRRTGLEQLSVDERYAAAFRRRWADLDMESGNEAEVVARLAGEPKPVVEEVAAALAGWLLYRRQTHQDEARWRRLYRLAEQLDTNGQRRQLRALLAGGLLPPVGIVAGLGGAGLPWTALWPVEQGHRWQQLVQLRQQVNVSREPALSVVLLAQACYLAGDTAGAESVLRQAVTTRPNEVILLHLLGRVLEERGRLPEALEYYRAARGVRPQLGVALGLALSKTGRGEEGAAVLRDLIDKQPTNPELYFDLGYVLDEQKKLPEAEAAFCKVIALDPDYAEAYFNLGSVLRDQKKLSEAEAVYRKAIALQPNAAKVYNNLGVLLCDYQKKPAEAEAAFRQAIARKPDYARAYYNIGNALRNQKKLSAAEAAYRKAIELQPDDVLAYNGLGIALRDQKKLVEAEAAYRQAIALNPRDAQAYINLGVLLCDYQDKPGEAEAAFRKAIALKPDSAEAHYNLGIALHAQKKLVEAEAAYRKADELLPGHPIIGDSLRRAQRLLRVDRKLAACLDGKERPASAQEAADLAVYAAYRERYRAAVRFYTEAFQQDPRFADDLAQQQRSNAARCAALAAAGKGNDAAAVDEAERVKLRRQALDWLRADLKAYRSLLEKNKDAATMQQVLTHWREDTDLASIRDPAALDKLPAAERDAWKQLWTDVEALHQRSQHK